MSPPEATGAAPIEDGGSRLLLAIYGRDGRHRLEEPRHAPMADAEELGRTGVEILFLNDGAIRASPPAGATANWRELGTGGVGFVRAMNPALREAAERRRDVLILPAGPLPPAETIREMRRVAALDPMIGFVAARTNHEYGAERFPNRSPAEAARRHAALASHLPDFTYVSTVPGMVVLIRWRVLAELGWFDEIYRDGAALHDLTMRAGRCGYRIVLANRAFVWCGDAPFSGGTRVPAILSQRYPEFAGLREADERSPERAAEHLLETLRPGGDDPLDLAFDFSTFGPAHNGTAKAGRQLLAAAAAAWRDRFRLFVLCTAETFRFHDYAELGVGRREPGGPERFAIIFRVGAPYNFATFERMAAQGLVLGLYWLDTIPVDCAHYTSPTLFNVWQLCLAHLDLLATTSDLTAAQLERRFKLPADLVRAKALHSLDLAEYRRRPEAGRGTAIPALAPGYLLIVGNPSWHKFVVPTANRLAAALPEHRILAFGARTRGETEPDGAGGDYPPPRLEPHPNLHVLADGTLTEADMASLYAKAAAIIFPSHYEGFGFPLLEALAMRRPIFLRRLPVFSELGVRLGANPNIRFYDTTAELAALLATPPVWIEVDEPAPSYRAADAAADIRAGLETALTQMRYDRVVARLRAVQTVRSGTAAPGPAYASPPERLGRAVERAAARLLSFGLIHRAARFFYRLAQAAVRR